MVPQSNHPNQGGENYSVDEMMARLKRNERQRKSADSGRKEGELVTRADGSQVVRVRKRKRRSKQPEKKKKATNPRLKWSIFGTLIGIFVLLIVCVVFIIVKYNGRSFKENTETTVSGLAGAESAELTQLRVTPVSAKAAKAELTWDRHSFYKSASFTNIKADIKATSFFSSEWIGEEVVASIGEVTLQTPESSVESTDDTVISPYEYGAYRCNQLDITFGAGPQAPAITGLQVSLRKQANERYQIVYNSGLMEVPNWPTLEISSGIITLSSYHAEIETRLEASNGLKGELLIKGRVTKDTSRPVVLDVKAKDYPVQQLLGKELGRLIQGEIQSDMGSLSYDYKKESGEALSFIMPFNSTELRFSELPMFTDLKDLTGDTQYVRPVLTHCWGTIMRTSEGVTLNDLNLSSSRVIKIKGNISVTPKGELSGELDVGIPSTTFGRDETPPSIFSEPHSGYIHTKVTLSGTIYNPHDDLNERLRASRGSSAAASPSSSRTLPLNKAREEARKKEKAFEELTR